MKNIVFLDSSSLPIQFHDTDGTIVLRVFITPIRFLISIINKSISPIPRTLINNRTHASTLFHWSWSKKQNKKKLSYPKSDFYFPPSSKFNKRGRKYTFISPPNNVKGDLILSTWPPTYKTHRFASIRKTEFILKNQSSGRRSGVGIPENNYRRNSRFQAEKQLLIYRYKFTQC